MVQKANVDFGEITMDKIMGKRELPYIHRLKSLYRGQIVRCTIQLSVERKK